MFDHLKHLVLAELVVVVGRVEFTSLHNKVVDFQFPGSLFNDFLLN